MGSIFGSALSSKFNAAFGGNRDCRGRPQGDYFFGCQVVIIVIIISCNLMFSKDVHHLQFNFPTKIIEFISLLVCGTSECGKEKEVSPFHKQQPGNYLIGC